MASNLERPVVIGITMGDPAGIGPEVTVAALADLTLPSARKGRPACVVFGSDGPLRVAADALGLAGALHWHRVSAAEWDADPQRVLAGFAPASDQTTVLLVDHTPADAAGAGALLPAGSEWWTQRMPSALGGGLSMAYLLRALASTWPESPSRLQAAGLARPFPAGSRPLIDAIVTAPIAKASWRLADVDRFPGHTELVACATGARRFAMMFVAPRLRVVLATIHIPLAAVSPALSVELIRERLRLTHDALVHDFNIPNPRIAVCGLNPHASEGGLFGNEEATVIAPAIAEAREQHGIEATGPWPGDTVFNAAVAGRFDAVLAMYHDQGTIPVKLLARDAGVNMTIGLPIVRTSPDHGTAFDIAGQGLADPGSMRAALSLAVDLARSRRGADRPSRVPRS